MIIIMIRTFVIALLFASCIFHLSCESDNSTPPPGTVTSRIINVSLRADQTVTYRARFDLDGNTIVSQAPSVVVAPNSVITLSFDALALPRGRHTIRATILAAVPIPAQYRMTANVVENGRTVVPNVPDVVANLGINGSLEVAITF